MPKNAIYFSYAWNDATNDQREVIIDDLFKYFLENGYTVKRDKQDLEYKDLISDYISQIGSGESIVIGVSDKYLKSEYCMTELNTIFLKSDSEEAEFIQKIFPIQLEDIYLNKPDTISQYLKYWEAKHEEWEKLVRENPGLGKKYYQIAENVKLIHSNIGNLLSYISDMLLVKATNYNIGKEKLIEAITKQYKISNNKPNALLEKEIDSDEDENNEIEDNTIAKNNARKKRKGCFSITITLTLSVLVIVSTYMFKYGGFGDSSESPTMQDSYTSAAGDSSSGIENSSTISDSLMVAKESSSPKSDQLEEEYKDAVATAAPPVFVQPEIIENTNLTTKPISKPSAKPPSNTTSKDIESIGKVKSNLKQSTNSIEPNKFIKDSIELKRFNDSILKAKKLIRKLKRIQR